MITPQEIIDAAVVRSTKNRPNLDATQGTELLGVVTRLVARYFSHAARINPTFFAVRQAVEWSAEALGWPRPAGAQSVFRIENGDGAEVVVVPFDDRQAEETKPAVYRFGKVYYSAGNVNDPTNGALQFFYAKSPAAPSSLDAPIDELWQEDFNELLILDVALYLAKKDGRVDEVAVFTAERDEWLVLFDCFLEHETVNEVRRFGSVRRFNTEAMVPNRSTTA